MSEINKEDNLPGNVRPTTPKPQTYNGDLRKLPRALAYLGNQKVWLCWKWEWNGKKWTKPPFRADNPMRHASSTDPNTWGSWKEAVDQVLAGKADGIGFTLKELNIGGIDLDHCRDPETGVIDLWAQEYLQRFSGAYVEATVSGTGLRIIGTSDIQNMAPKFRLPEKGNGAALELFSNSSHYLTLSGNEIRQCISLPPIGEQMTAIATELGRKKDRSHGSEAEGLTWSPAAETKVRSALFTISTNEETLTAKFGDSHGTWIRVGRALERLDWGERGFALWHDWSKQNEEKYNPDGLRTQWDSFHRTRNSRENPVHINTLFYLARQFGWSNDCAAGQKKSWKDGLITARELKTKKFDPMRIILPGLITEGLTILAAKPKIGKSWLALDVCLAVAGDRFVLGNMKPVQGDVLYLALEDNDRRLNKRLNKILQQEEGPEHLELHTEWKRLDQGGLDNIAAWCEQHPDRKLIWIDTLARVRPKAGRNDQPYDADYNALGALQQLSLKYQIAIVINHHLRKMSSEDDPFDDVNGTQGLHGSADALIVMKKHSGLVKIFVHGREVEDGEFAAEFDRNTCRWKLMGDAVEAFRSKERQGIIAALEEAKEPLSIPGIMAATGRTDRHAITHLLYKMRKDGEVVSKHGKHSLPQPPNGGDRGDHDDSSASKTSQHTDNAGESSSEGRSPGRSPGDHRAPKAVIGRSPGNASGDHAGDHEKKKIPLSCNNLDHGDHQITAITAIQHVGTEPTQPQGNGQLAKKHPLDVPDYLLRSPPPKEGSEKPNGDGHKPTLCNLNAAEIPSVQPRDTSSTVEEADVCRDCGKEEEAMEEPQADIPLVEASPPLVPVPDIPDRRTAMPGDVGPMFDAQPPDGDLPPVGPEVDRTCHQCNDDHVDGSECRWVTPDGKIAWLHPSSCDQHWRKDHPGYEHRPLGEKDLAAWCGEDDFKVYVHSYQRNLDGGMSEEEANAEMREWLSETLPHELIELALQRIIQINQGAR
jgi:hypothetical protein